jgi:hypothetical protein
MVAMVLFEIEGVLLNNSDHPEDSSVSLRNVVSALAAHHKIGAITSSIDGERRLLQEWGGSIQWDMISVVSEAATPSAEAVLSTIEPLRIRPSDVAYVATFIADTPTLLAAGFNVIIYDPLGTPGESTRAVCASDPQGVMEAVVALDSGPT